MAARLVVDGNNVMGSRPDGWWRDRTGAARRLVEAIEAWAGEREVLVVFDGAAPAGAGGAPRVAVRHSGPRSADDVIADHVRAAEDPSAITVVTSDAGLAGRVRACGASVTGAGAFRRELGA